MTGQRYNHELAGQGDAASEKMAYEESSLNERDDKKRRSGDERTRDLRSGSNPGTNEEQGYLGEEPYVREQVSELVDMARGWVRRFTDTVETNPGAAAAAVGVLGLLTGAGAFGAKKYRSEPTTLDTLHAKLDRVLDAAGKVLETSKSTADHVADKAVASSSDLSAAAGERLSTFGQWLREAAPQLSEEIPAEIKRVGERGIEEVKAVVKKRPVESALVIGAATVVAGYLVVRGRSRTVHQERGGRSGHSRRNSRTYEECTREELYNLAKDLEIEGRSSMTKEELVEALKSTKRNANKLN